MSKTVAMVLAFAVFVAAVTAVAWYSSRPDAAAGKLAASADAEQRKAAADRLGTSRSEQAVTTLQRLAKDKDEWVATKAVRSIGQYRTPERRDVLARMVHDRSLSGRARAEAAATLGKFEDADPKVLTSALCADPDAKVRRGAAEGLVQMKKPEALPELVQALSDPDEKVRAYANAAIHNMIVRRFEFDPRKPPGTQQQVIERLKAYLRQCKAL